MDDEMSAYGGGSRSARGGRRSKTKTVLAGVGFFLVLVLVLVLVLFVVIIPKGLEQAFRDQLKIENVTVTNHTRLVQGTTRFNLSLKGYLQHPDPFMGFRTELHMLQFLDKHKRPLITAQQFQETSLPATPLKKKFQWNAQFEGTLALYKAFLNSLSSPAVSEGPAVSFKMKGKSGLGKALILNHPEFNMPFSILKAGVQLDQAKIESGLSAETRGMLIQNQHVHTFSQGDVSLGTDCEFNETSFFQEDSTFNHCDTNIAESGLEGAGGKCEPNTSLASNPKDEVMPILRPLLDSLRIDVLEIISVKSLYSHPESSISTELSISYDPQLDPFKNVKGFGFYLTIEGLRRGKVDIQVNPRPAETQVLSATNDQRATTELTITFFIDESMEQRPIACQSSPKEPICVHDIFFQLHDSPCHVFSSKSHFPFAQGNSEFGPFLASFAETTQVQHLDKFLWMNVALLRKFVSQVLVSKPSCLHKLEVASWEVHQELDQKVVKMTVNIPRLAIDISKLTAAGHLFTYQDNLIGAFDVETVLKSYVDDEQSIDLRLTLHSRVLFDDELPSELNIILSRSHFENEPLSSFKVEEFESDGALGGLLRKLHRTTCHTPMTIEKLKGIILYYIDTPQQGFKQVRNIIIEEVTIKMTPFVEFDYIPIEPKDFSEKGKGQVEFEIAFQLKSDSTAQFDLVIPEKSVEVHFEHVNFAILTVKQFACKNCLNTSQRIHLQFREVDPLKSADQLEGFLKSLQDGKDAIQVGFRGLLYEVTDVHTKSSFFNKDVVMTSKRLYAQLKSLIFGESGGLTEFPKITLYNMGFECVIKNALARFDFASFTYTNAAISISNLALSADIYNMLEHLKVPYFSFPFDGFLPFHQDVSSKHYKLSLFKNLTINPLQWLIDAGFHEVFELSNDLCSGSMERFDLSIGGPSPNLAKGAAEFSLPSSSRLPNISFQYILNSEQSAQINARPVHDSEYKIFAALNDRKNGLSQETGTFLFQDLELIHNLGLRLSIDTVRLRPHTRTPTALHNFVAARFGTIFKSMRPVSPEPSITETTPFLSFKEETNAFTLEAALSLVNAYNATLKAEYLCFTLVSFTNLNHQEALNIEVSNLNVVPEKTALATIKIKATEAPFDAIKYKDMMTKQSMKEFETLYLMEIIRVGRDAASAVDLNDLSIPTTQSPLLWIETLLRMAEIRPSNLTLVSEEVYALKSGEVRTNYENADILDFNVDFKPATTLLNGMCDFRMSFSSRFGEDGFHLKEYEIRRNGSIHVKGALHTYEAMFRFFETYYDAPLFDIRMSVGNKYELESWPLKTGPFLRQFSPQSTTSIKFKRFNIDALESTFLQPLLVDDVITRSELSTATPGRITYSVHFEGVDNPLKVNLNGMQLRCMVRHHETVIGQLGILNLAMGQKTTSAQLYFEPSNELDGAELSKLIAPEQYFSEDKIPDYALEVLEIFGNKHNESYPLFGRVLARLRSTLVRDQLFVSPVSLVQEGSTYNLQMLLYNAKLDIPFLKFNAARGNKKVTYDGQMCLKEDKFLSLGSELGPILAHDDGAQITDLHFGASKNSDNFRSYPTFNVTVRLPWTVLDNDVVEQNP